MKTNIRTNVVVNIIRTITMTILSFITFPWVCRVLGDSALGAYTWCTTFVYYFLILARISIPNIAVRECIKVKDDPAKLSARIQEFFILQSVMTMLSFGLMATLVLNIPELKQQEGLIFILSLNFLAGVFSFEWLFTAFEKHIYMAVRSIITLAIVDILIFMFVVRPADVEMYAFFTISVTLLIVISNLIYLPRLLKGKVDFKHCERLNFRQYRKTLLVLFVISFVVAVYDKTDTFILGLIDEKAAVGSYSVAMKGVEIIIGIILALGTVFMPRASAYYAEGNEKQFTNLNKYSNNICLFITIPAVATMSTLATPITSLISGEYDNLSYVNANWVLVALCSLMITYSLCDIIYTQVLIPTKKEKLYMLTMSVGAVLNIGLSLLFGLVIFNDPSTRAIGVAIGTSIADLVMLIILIALTWKHTKKIILDINNLKIAGIGIIVGVFSYFVGNALYGAFAPTMGAETAYILELLLVVLMAAVIYIGSLTLLREKLLMSIFHRNKKKEITN